MISMQVHAIIFAFVLYWHDLHGMVFSLIYFVIVTPCVSSPPRIAHCVDRQVYLENVAMPQLVDSHGLSCWSHSLASFRE